MSIFKKKSFPTARSDGNHKRKIQPAGAWSNYRKKNRPYSREQIPNEKKLLIEVESVSYSYEGREVISNLSLKIYSGDYICIVGENGSGKTTLMNGLLGLKKPSSGKVVLHDIKRSEIGVLPQKTPVQNDFCALTSEIVLSGRAGKKRGIAFYGRRDRQIAFENMEKLGITSIAKSSFRTLSGGQQQRVLLSRALCAAEKLLVLDEPTTGLDARTLADMYKLIHDINKRENMAIVMVSHDISGVLEHADKILHLGKNSVFFGTKEEYLRSPMGAQLAVTNSAAASDKAYEYKYTGGEKNV